MSSSVEFVLDWKVTASQLSTISENKPLQSAPFIISYNNVPLTWNLMLKKTNKSDVGVTEKINFFVYFIDSPLNMLRETGIWFGAAGPKNQMPRFSDDQLLEYSVIGQASHKFQLGKVFGWILDKQSFYRKYGLNDDDPLEFRVKLNISVADFGYTIDFPTVKPASDLMIKLFDNFDNYPSLSPSQSKSDFSDVILIANDDEQFYCHRVILGGQSKPLAKMLDGQSGMKEVQDGVVRFPTMNGVVLKGLLKYLYVGLDQKCSNDYSTETLTSLLDVAEQYELENLKMFCSATLWRRIQTDPNQAVQVLQSASLLNLKALKSRALDVISDNYKSINDEIDLYEVLDKDLCRSLMEHMAGRLRVQKSVKA